VPSYIYIDGLLAYPAYDKFDVEINAVLYQTDFTAVLPTLKTGF
jgi:hypothetical protein